ncbi:hypothetical protein Tco_0981636 [Tanacetum coccineum]
MIGSLMYLTASRPDIQFSTCLCARYQANPKESHLVAVKRIRRYLKGTPNLGLWYPKGPGFDLKAYSESNYDGCNLDRKSTSGGCQILDQKLVCWSAKKQSFVAMSSIKAEYVAAAGCCAQVLWIKSQLADYDVLYDKVPIFWDNTSVIAISNNPVLHSKTKHIDISTEADSATKTVTFILLCFNKPLSFDLDLFSTVIWSKPSENYVSVPPKENVKGLEIDLVEILFSDVIANMHRTTGKPERKANICYTRYMSLIMEHMLKYAYKNNDLMSLKPHHITAITFKHTLENETALTAHMCKAAELLPDPIKYLLPPSREVNVDDTADKSSSRTSVQPFIQPKPPTNLKLKKKTILPSSKPKYSIQVRDVPPKKQVAETQPTEETVATAGDDIERLKMADVLNKNVQEEVKESGIESLGDVTFDQLMDEIDQKNKAAQEKPDNPYDTESEIKFIKSFKVSTLSSSLCIYQEKEEHTIDA